MDLGSVHSVSLRDLWPGEATHFTPWLANNLQVLGSKLGMDLVLETVEAAAGSFSADIIAVDLSTNRRVVIENQFGGTDHRHLGQILTYSSVLGAGVVVWIAEVVRPEHKAAIDFLNQNLTQGLALYAVEASAIRIDESKPAFLLNVVSLPAEAPAAIRDGSEQRSETAEKYRSYFQQLIDELREQHRFTNARAGQPQNWYTFASDNSRLYKFGTSFSQGGRVRVEVYIDSGDKAVNEQLFDCLFAQRDAITASLGEELQWDRLDSRRACRVATYRDGDIDADSQTLAEIRQWAIARLLRFKQVFSPCLRACQIAQTPA